MKRADRQRLILDRIARSGECTVEALVASFGVSPETIRRDLAQLAEDGAIRKVHGGARRAALLTEASFEERQREDAAAKALIGRKLAGLLRSGETLFMDTGSTTLACAEAIVARDGLRELTVITNALRIAEVLGAAPGGHRVFLIGGGYRGGNCQTYGPLAIEAVGRFHADRAVLTVSALDAAAGGTDADFDEAQLARAMIANAGNLVIAAHSAKFGRRAAFAVCRPGEIGVLVSETRPPEPLAAALEAAGTEMI